MVLWSSIHDCPSSSCVHQHKSGAISSFFSDVFKPSSAEHKYIISIFTAEQLCDVGGRSCKYCVNVWTEWWGRSAIPCLGTSSQKTHGISHVGRDLQRSGSPTPGSIGDHPKFKPCVWECYQNTSWTPTACALFMGSICCIFLGQLTKYFCLWSVTVWTAIG